MEFFASVWQMSTECGRVISGPGAVTVNGKENLRRARVLALLAKLGKIMESQMCNGREREKTLSTRMKS